MALTQVIPALPVASVASAIACWTERLGFSVAHQDGGFAVLIRDEAVVHLWQSDDDGWRVRPGDDLATSPVVTGAETFLAGTASCRIRCTSSSDLDTIHAELSASDALHPTDTGAPVDTPYGAREVNALDEDGNCITFFYWV
ncbi:VOC family protein [Nocardioides sp.]|uniref:VOC family protein n=1 Tax=Nocardioides sp. TaxID=35761 RepID=UPI002602DC74|nr:VOC family protein [Nocardioides sp.]